MVYQWKAGSRKSGDATAVGQELERLGEAIDAPIVVEKARNKKSVLHSYFEWDDSAAAEEYRLVQARELIRSLVVVVENKKQPDEPITIRAYEHVSMGDDASPKMAYIPITKVLCDDDLREQVITRLYNTIVEAEETTKKYEHLIGSLGRVRGKLAEARLELAVS